MSLKFLFVATLFAVASVGSTFASADTKPTLPRLIDLGAGKCIPCKQMKPILNDLSTNYADQFEVIFIDVWEKREEGQKYGIRMIPTQIFFAADGRELARHEGFMSKKDILDKWKELGIEVKNPSAAKTN